MRITIAAAAALSLLLGGCTTSLNTRPAYRVSDQDKALGGISYSLPMLQYGVDLTYTLKQCPTVAGSVQKGNLVQKGDFAFKVSATATSQYVAGETYDVDYRALVSVFKVTDFSVETYASGALKALNASAEDKSADIVKSAVEFGVTAASMAAGSPAVAAGAAMADDDGVAALADPLILAATMTVPICTDKAVKALADAAAARIQVKKLTDATTADTKTVDAIGVRATNKLVLRSDRRTLYDAQLRQIDRAVTLAAEQKALSDAEEILSFKDDLLWPEDAFTTQGSLAANGALDAWLKPLVELTSSNIVDEARLRAALAAEIKAKRIPPEKVEAIEKYIGIVIADSAKENKAGLCAPGATVANCLAAKVGVYAELVPPVAKPGPCGAAPYETTCLTSANTVAARTDVDHEGIFIRQAARGRLFLCDENRACSGGDRAPLVKGEWLTAPQLGQLRFVPFHNGPFQNNALSVQLAEDGTITKMQYAEKAAILASALASASAAATKVDAYLDDREKEKKQAIVDARAEQTYQRTEAAYQRGLITTQRADEIAALQFDIDKITKEQELLAKQRPAPPAGSPLSNDFAEETQRLNAIAAQKQAQLSILTTQACSTRWRNERTGGRRAMPTS